MSHLMDTYPKYDGSADASAWAYGMANVAFTAGQGEYAGHTGTTAGTWGIDTLPLDLEPGTYYLTEVGIIGGFTAEADCVTARFAIFEDDGGSLTPVAFDDGTTYVDMSDDINHSDYRVGPTTVPSLAFTLESGKSYQLVWGLLKAGTTNLRPGVRRMNDGEGPQGLTCYTNAAESMDFPAAYTGVANSSGEVPRGYIEFTTPVRKLQTGGYSSATDRIIPRRTDGDYCIKFKNCVVAAGNDFTCEVARDNIGNDVTRTTLVLDMGATDQITLESVNVALNAGTAEAGDKIDMLLELRDDDTADVFYQNKDVGQGPEGTDDPLTRSHAVKNAGTRGSSHSAVAAAEYIKMSGTAAVASIEVGWEPIVIFGDSQNTISGEGDILSSDDRLGKYLPAAFTHDRIYWPAWRAGNHVATTSGGAHTAGYLRYKNTTAGDGDLCEMTTPLFIVSGFGINDIASIGTTEASRNKIVALMTTRLADILDDLQDRAIPTLIIGLPPYSDSNASVQEAGAVRQWNGCLEGMALGVRAAYYNPWHFMGSGYDASGIMQMRESGDGGLHYADGGDGPQGVAREAARSLETGLVGGIYSNPNRRRARGMGMLLP